MFIAHDSTFLCSMFNTITDQSQHKEQVDSADSRLLVCVWFLWA